MSENKHTPEPWRIGSLESYDGYTGQPFRNVWAGEGDDATVVARAMRTKGAMKNDVDADARRIVACVNACAGISTDNLNDNLPVKELARRYNEALKQRDELLAALERFMDSHEECTDFDGFTAQIVSMADYHQAQEAIARAKGEQ